jgi:hypothetical protein
MMRIDTNEFSAHAAPPEMRVRTIDE